MGVQIIRNSVQFNSPPPSQWPSKISANYKITWHVANSPTRKNVSSIECFCGYHASYGIFVITRSYTLFVDIQSLWCFVDIRSFWCLFVDICSIWWCHGHSLFLFLILVLYINNIFKMSYYRCVQDQGNEEQPKNFKTET